jgi:hypothetical protein
LPLIRGVDSVHLTCFFSAAGNSWIDGGMTVEKCVSFCDSTGFNYAGAEFGVRVWYFLRTRADAEQNECYCDNTISLANGGGVPASSASRECCLICPPKVVYIFFPDFRMQ